VSVGGSDVVLVASTSTNASYFADYPLDVVVKPDERLQQEQNRAVVLLTTKVVTLACCMR
jgi:hypothetical protein